jgi:hypothetical protein
MSPIDRRSAMNRLTRDISAQRCPFVLKILKKVPALMLNPWLALSFKAFQLGIEAQSVVALRMMRLASGGVGSPRIAIGNMLVAGCQSTLK